MLNKVIQILKKNEKLSIIIYKLFFDFIYVTLISKIFLSDGFNLNFCFYKYLFSWFGLIILLKYFKKIVNIETFSNMIILFMCLMYFIPLSTLYAFMDLSNVFYICSYVYMFLLIIFNDKLGYLKIKLLNQKYVKYIFDVLLIIIPIFVFIISYIYTGFRISLDFINVYDIRLEASKYDMPLIIKYLFSFVEIIVPILLVYTLHFKKKFFSILIIFTELVIFSFAAQKSFLIFTLAILVGYFLYKKNYLKYIPYIFICVIIFVLLEMGISGNTTILSLVYRRNFFLPPFISNQYFEFFSNNPLNMFTNGFMGKLGFPEIYSLDISSVIGNMYDIASTYKNNGLLGDVFANLGYIGVVVMPIILVITFRVMDAFTYSLKRNLIIGFVVYFSMKFVNSFWSINLLSGGFIILIILLYLFASICNERQEETKITFNYKKIFMSIFIFGLIGYLYGVIISKNTYIQSKDLSIDLPRIEESSGETYNNLLIGSKKVIDEINDFDNYFEFNSIKNDRELLNNIYNELIENPEIENSEKLKLLYDTIDIINKKLLKQKNINIDYVYEDGNISNYNIYYISNYNYNKNAKTIMTIFFMLFGLFFSTYLECIKKTKSTKVRRKKIKVCHITSAHPRYDGRIFQKECGSLSKKFDVFLLVNDDLKDEKINNVSIVSTKFKPKNRFDRFFKSKDRIIQKALEIDADIYHLHDPDLLGIVGDLKKEDKKVIFDSHENYPQLISEKEWIPKHFRKIVSILYGIREKQMLKKVDGVVTTSLHIQERIERINPRTYMVTNYPILSKSRLRKNDDGKTVCFAGGISNQWMHQNVIKAINDIDDIHYLLIGNNKNSYFEKLKSIEGFDKVIPVGQVPKKEVLEYYKKSTLGIALNDYVANVNFKMGTLGNTKLFEYMEAGLPIVCTDFILWREIVEKYNCGICVNPNNIIEITDAIKYIISHPKEAKKMGDNGRKLAKEKYNWDTQEKILFELYDKLINN